MSLYYGPCSMFSLHKTDMRTIHIPLLVPIRCQLYRPCSSLQKKKHMFVQLSQATHNHTQTHTQMGERKRLHLDYLTMRRTPTLKLQPCISEAVQCWRNMFLKFIQCFPLHYPKGGGSLPTQQHCPSPDEGHGINK